MLFWENPFFRLTVHSRDKEQQIREALATAIAKASSKPEKRKLDNAAYVLGRKVKRLSAEFFWPCGMEKEKAYQLISLAKNGILPDLPDEHPRLSVITAMNVLASGCAQDPANAIAIIMKQAPRIDLSASACEFNQDRKLAKMPLIREDSHMELWLRDLPRQTSEALHLAGKTMGPSLYAACMAPAMEEPFSLCPITFAMIHTYLEDVQPLLAELGNDLRYGLMIAPAHSAQSLELLSGKLDTYLKLLYPLLLWNRRMPPIWPLPEKLLQEWAAAAVRAKQEGHETTSSALHRLLIRKAASLPEIESAFKNALASEEKNPSPPPSLGDLPNVPKRIAKIPDLPRKKETDSPAHSFSRLTDTFFSFRNALARSLFKS